MRVRAWVRSGVVLGGAAALLTACSGGGEGEVAPEKVSLESLMGVPSDDDFDFGSAVEQIEDGVADCMANEGWTYFPRRLPAMPSAFTEGGEDEVARIQREGLGISVYLLNSSDDGGELQDPAAPEVDHNEDYVATLNEAEKKAYDASLYGTEEEQAADTITVFDPATGEETTRFLGSVGCRGQARDAYYGDDPSHNPDYQEAMQAYWDELATRIEADSRRIALDEEWAACMSNAGYDYETPQQFADAAYVEFTLRADEVVGPEFYADPMEGWTPEAQDEFWASATEADVAALYSAAAELSPAQRTQLEAIFIDEVAVALAAHACAEGYDEKVDEIAADVEEQFALEHEDELRELAATIFGGP